MSTVMLGAFLSAENSVESAVACCAFTGIAGELAAKETTAQDVYKRQAQEEEALKDHETPKLRKRLIASVIFLVVLMYFSMGHMMWGWPVPAAMKDNHVAMGLLQMLLTIIVMVINQKFFVSGFTSLLHGAPNMDTLVALGAGASFGYSTYALFAMTGTQVRGDMDAVMGYMHEFYFESAAMILTLITVGKKMCIRDRSQGALSMSADNLREEIERLSRLEYENYLASQKR